MIAGVVLAAGKSTRFGSDKLAAQLGGQAVVRWSVSALLPLVDVVHVVVGHGSTAVQTALEGLDVIYVVNTERDEGMASSIRAGIAALAPEVTAAVVILGDQPLISSLVIERVIARWRTGDCAAVVAQYADARGHPALFGRECFSALAGVRGDVGARSVLADLAERLGVVTVAGTAPIDVDTLGSLEEVRRQGTLASRPVLGNLQ